MFVWWGDSLINLYNDAYKAIVGGKHPEALGQPAAVVWREIWDQIGPRAETTMRGSAGTYDEALLLIMERHGYQEETYYTFSYSPVPNDRGGIGGLICANTDDTRRIIGERQMALLRDLAACTADARTLRSRLRLCARSLESERPGPAVCRHLSRRCAGRHPHPRRRGRPWRPATRRCRRPFTFAEPSPWPFDEVLQRERSRGWSPAWTSGFPRSAARCMGPIAAAGRAPAAVVAPAVPGPSGCCWRG